MGFAGIEQPFKTVLVTSALAMEGKSTTVANLAVVTAQAGNKVILVDCDLRRPSIHKLFQISNEMGFTSCIINEIEPERVAHSLSMLNLHVLTSGPIPPNPAEILNSMRTRNMWSDLKERYDYVFIDTAGRLHIDEALMDELKEINNEVKPDEILLVIDSMIGQDAINVIDGFNNELPLTGTILTKMDGDTKGGVALSVRHLTNIPIKFIGTSEKLDGITEFDTNRMVGRILGEGDLQALIEHAEEVIDEKEAMEAAKKLNSGKFDLDDFLVQLKAIKKLGPLENMLKLIPGASKMGLNNITIDPKQISHIEAIISSMTKKERKNPDIIKASRKKRIASGSGRSVEEVNRLLNQFENMKKMMKQFKNGNMKLPF